MLSRFSTEKVGSGSQVRKQGQEELSLSDINILSIDHVLDQDENSQLEIYAGRGVLSESQGPVWMIGTGM